MSHTYRADVQRKNEDDEKAQIPGQQCAKENHALLLLEVSIAMQEEESQEKDHHNLYSQRCPTHSADRTPLTLPGTESNCRQIESKEPMTNSYKLHEGQVGMGDSKELPLLEKKSFMSSFVGISYKISHQFITIFI